MSNYLLNQEVLSPKPKEIWLFDDIIAKGTHFRAICEVLKEKFPDVPIVGFFIARTIFK
jgi:predicted amidophosphoribosyltransferase